MYAVVRRYDGVTDLAEAARRVQEGFIPLLREVPGFVAYYALDAGGGVIVSLCGRTAYVRPVKYSDRSGWSRTCLV